MKAAAAQVGVRVTTSGYPGTITKVCEWSRHVVDGVVVGVMVEVRLASGTCCVSASDVEPDPTAPSQAGNA